MTMWKTAFTLFILFASLISGMLFWQWQAYSEANQTVEKPIEEVETVVTIKTMGKDLSVTQTFTGLQDGKEYQISIPERALDWECIKENGEFCESFDDNPITFLAEKGMLQISYFIPLENENHPFLLEQFIAQLTEYETLRTEIVIIDQERRDGTWIAGLPLRGTSEQEFIDYFVFEGNFSSPSLYWQPEKLLTGNGPYGVNYYFSSPMEAYPELPSLEKLINFSGMSVIMTEAYHEKNGHGLLIVQPNITQDMLERKIVYNYFYHRDNELLSEELWLLDVLTALITESDSHFDKGNLMIETLKGEMAEEPLQVFLHHVMVEKSLSPQKMDKHLSTVLGKKTEFFSLNSKETNPFVPLYFVDDRKLMINDMVQENIRIIVTDFKNYFPFVETLTALGFEVKVLEDEETILINKEGNHYRFFIGQNIFIYNQEDYGLLANPLTIFNGEIYMESGWLKSIFNIMINETEEEISLSLSGNSI